jgi:O-glycosyl hydrolase
MTVSEKGNWGFIHADFEKEEIYMTKSYWAMAHYSRFIRPGSMVLDVTTPEKSDKVSLVVAYYNNEIILVCTNASKNGTLIKIDLSKFIRDSKEQMLVLSYITTKSKDLCITLKINL